jgi:hypothetical protein
MEVIRVTDLIDETDKADGLDSASDPDDSDESDAAQIDPSGQGAIVQGRRAINRSRALGRRLTDQQWQYVLAFVAEDGATRGDYAEAAAAAGYHDPERVGRRLILQPHIAEAVRELALSDARARMPLALAIIADIAANAEDDKTRLEAARTLWRLGAAELPRKPAKESAQSPAVAVQINTGHAGASGAGQALVREIWRERLIRTRQDPASLAVLHGARVDADVDADVDAGGAQGGVPTPGSRPARDFPIPQSAREDSSEYPSEVTLTRQEYRTFPPQRTPPRE